jgi:uncharacterized membrane protein YhdT
MRKFFISLYVVGWCLIVYLQYIYHTNGVYDNFSNQQEWVKIGAISTIIISIVLLVAPFTLNHKKLN